MLELILDKEFADKFLHTYSGNDGYEDVFLKYFIRNLQQIKLVSNYLDKEDIMKQARGNPLLEIIIESIPSLDFRADLLPHINTTEFPGMGSPVKLILTGEDTESCIDRRKRFGLEYINPNILSERLSPLNFYKDIYQNQEYSLVETNGSIHEGWACILKDISLNPANSLIIQDNYIFSQRSATFIQNTLRIIEKFLNKELNIQFELLILSLNGNNEQRTWYENALANLVHEVRIKITENFNAGILIHPFPGPHHKRLLISNSSLSSSDWGFNAFNHSRSYHDNDIHVRGLLQGNKEGGDTPLSTICRKIDKIKNTLNRVQAGEIAGLRDNTRMTIGNCNNRLLQM